MSPLAAL